MDLATKKYFIECGVQFEEDQVHDPQPTKEGIVTPPTLCAYNDVFTNISESESEEKDQDDQDLDVWNELQVDPDLLSIPNQNPNPIWAQASDQEWILDMDLESLEIQSQ